MIFAAEAVLDDQRGTLAEACAVLDDLDIQSILVADTHLGKALVSFGFATQQEADEARTPRRSRRSGAHADRGLGRPTRRGTRPTRIRRRIPSTRNGPQRAAPASETSAGDLGCRIASRSLAVPCPIPGLRRATDQRGTTMHRQVNALVSAGGSPGKLAIFGKALGSAGLDIEAIGGAEWKHDGPLCLILREDGHEAMDKFAESATSSRCRG